MNKLQTYKGWTVDYKLKEFRKVTYSRLNGFENMRTIPFSIERGDQMLAEMIKKDLVPKEILVDLF